ncbi:MAG: hypothetical protein ACXQT4_06540 [Methanotrichaceae archaeon]
MNKKSLEIGISIGLVFLMVIFMIVVQMIMPEGLCSIGFVMAVLAFMVLMSAAGFKLTDLEH